ncbi:MAG: Mur ligase domain-containing protein [bacterium]
MALYFFVGIGGTGMSALAQIVLRRGNEVWGSDRSRDRGLNRRLFNHLKKFGVRLFPQDGSGVVEGVDYVVASAAVEDTVPEMVSAKKFGIPVLRRAELLAEHFNGARGVAVGGTSGKSTTAAMTGWILHAAGRDPTVVNGAVMRNFEKTSPPGNAVIGTSDLFVIESDESDGSIALYNPAVSVVTNISKDHRPVPELRRLFRDFGRRASECVVANADCPEVSSLGFGKTKTFFFSVSRSSDLKARDVRLDGLRSTFTAGGAVFRLKLPGLHNVYNALAAAAAAKAVGVAEAVSADALTRFEGVRQRFEVIGEAAGVTVVEDFAHNPEKIAAILGALNPLGRRLLIVFQPHGYGPTAFLKDELVESLSSNMSDSDVLYMPEIYYAGGTAARTVSSRDIADAVRKNGRNAVFYADRRRIVTAIADEAKEGDMVLVMGARDPSLTDFCRRTLAALRKKHG